MDPIRARLKEILMDLEKNTREIRASAVIRRDGIMIESTLPVSIGTPSARKINTERGSATIARLGGLLVNTAEVASAELGKGELKQLIIDTDNGKIVAVGAGNEVVLLCHVKEANPLVLLNISSYAERVRQVLI